ncbi:MAG: hypothetical protein ACRD1Z_13015, partial [Vicinamibacteria bacterium]
MRSLFLMWPPLALLSCGPRHEISYPLSPPAQEIDRSAVLLLDKIRDARPEGEASGKVGETLLYESRDSHFRPRPLEGIAAVLALELEGAGFDPRNQAQLEETKGSPDYRLLVTLRHFKVRIAPDDSSSAGPSGDGAKGRGLYDSFLVHVEIDASVVRGRDNRVVMNRLFNSKREFQLRRKVARVEEDALWKRWDLWRPKQVGNELALAYLDEELRRVVSR